MSGFMVCRMRIGMGMQSQTMAGRKAERIKDEADDLISEGSEYGATKQGLIAEGRHDASSQIFRPAHTVKDLRRVLLKMGYKTGRESAFQQLKQYAVDRQGGAAAAQPNNHLTMQWQPSTGHVAPAPQQPGSTAEYHGRCHCPVPAMFDEKYQWVPSVT